MTKPLSAYQQAGFADRFDYLQNLAYEYGLDVETVGFVAGVLGESEDFDGLLSELDSIAEAEQNRASYYGL